jgi:hypothetical protein
MSLSRAIFTMSPSEQKKAIEEISRKAIQLWMEQSANWEKRGSPRDVFDAHSRRLLHAKHAAGASKDELNTIRKAWRKIFHRVRLAEYPTVPPVQPTPPPQGFKLVRFSSQEKNKCQPSQ